MFVLGCGCAWDVASFGKAVFGDGSRWELRMVPLIVGTRLLRRQR